MNQDSIDRIKSKLQELTAIIKEEAISETRELREDLLENVNELKTTLESKLKDAEVKSRAVFDEKKDGVKETFEKTQEEIGDNLHDLLSELEFKALKIQYSVQEKFQEGVSQKDEIVAKAADSIIDLITKAKNALQSQDRAKE